MPAAFHITPHSAKSLHSLHFVTLGATTAALRCAPFGFAERGVMSGPPQQLHRLACAVHGFFQALRAHDVYRRARASLAAALRHQSDGTQEHKIRRLRAAQQQHPRPPRPSCCAGSHSYLVAPSPHNVPSSRPPQGAPHVQAAAPHGKIHATPTALCKRCKPYTRLHRTAERFSSSAVKAKPCGRCAAWTESAARQREQKTRLRKKRLLPPRAKSAKLASRKNSKNPCKRIHTHRPRDRATSGEIRQNYDRSCRGDALPQTPSVRRSVAALPRPAGAAAYWTLPAKTSGVPRLRR